MKHKIENVESYETKNRGRLFLWNINQRTLIPMKLKIEDVESYEIKNRGLWVLWI